MAARQSGRLFYTDGAWGPQIYFFDFDTGTNLLVLNTGGNAAHGSGQAGFSVMGMGHHFIECEAERNGKDGIRLMGMHYEIKDCRTLNNGDDGISGTGSAWRLVGNEANDNGGNGILARGAPMDDGGGNRGSGNRGRHEEGRPPVQCEIGGRACAP